MTMARCSTHPERRPGMGEAKGCKGWGYHVFTLGSETCSVCGCRREEARRE